MSLRPSPGVIVTLVAATALGLMNAGSRYLTGATFVRGAPATGWDVVWPALLGAYLWAATVPLILAALRRWPLDSFRRPGRIAVHAGAAAGVVLLQSTVLFLAVNVFSGFVPAPTFFLRAPFRRSLASNFRPDLVTYASLAAVLWAAEAARRRRAEDLRGVRARARLSEARLEALEAQLHPHFVFNTLHAVRQLFETDPDAAERAIGLLRDLLASVLRPSAPTAPLADEFAFLERYFSLLGMRFGSRLSWETSLEPAARDLAVPRLLLQPLVENAVRHGFAARAGPRRIEVEGAVRGDALVLEVRDDGPGFTGDPFGGPGLGLRNVRDRLEALLGPRARLTVGPRAPGGVLSRVEIPVELLAGARSAA